MTARMKNPATFLPQAAELLMALGKIGADFGVDEATLELTHLRVSQINGCAWCLEFGRHNARTSGLTDSQLIQLAGWADATIFSDAQRAALALAEHMTRMADRSNAVPDAIWDEAARHYGEKELAGLVVWIATTNLYNRINVTTRQIPGTW
ncbi:alkylhydroperoxidase AhpD family core domain-containing protein [Microlunatus soli]|uniref:Alkylhydroperoxidase AhpD family core domain-containing protein n=2 Tax=Microlunatus soli TaxID=630515 RepID=A0A1H1PUF4_9ACTN|nr:alkylhydroperoxidase AhpD family core domain-containing protein [Microlunatus soli]